MTDDHTFTVSDRRIEGHMMVLVEECEGHRGGLDPMTGRPTNEWVQCSEARETWYRPWSVVDMHREHVDEDEDASVHIQDIDSLEWPAWVETALDAVERRIVHGPDGRMFDPDRPEIAVVAATSETEYRVIYERVDEGDDV